MAAKPKRKIGRPDGLTPQVEEKLLNAVRAGAYLKEAAEHAGVGERTVYGWIERADDPKAPAKFSQFAQALTRAKADAQVGAVAVIRRAMSTDWRAAAFYLERSDPKRWGRSTRHEVSGRDGEPLVPQRGDLDREIAKLLKQMEALDGVAVNGNGRPADS